MTVSEKYGDGKSIDRGYYIRKQHEDCSRTITPLSSWLKGK